MTNDVLNRLSETLEQRKLADPAQSYVAQLYQRGVETMAKKIGEEATEVVIAAVRGDRAALVHEVADLWFHTLVTLAHFGCTHEVVLDELARRFGLSGIEEKAGRPGK